MAQNKVIAQEKLVLIGGSAGSLEVLLAILPRLRTDLGFPIVLVLHRKPSGDSILTDLLAAKTALPVKEIEEKERISPGIIHIAPADYHLLFESDHTFSLDYSEKVNYSRPSLDVVFQSAAEVFGASLVCILLSGANADGTDGCRYVKEKGGTTIAQQPDTADVSYMPQHAITDHVIDHVMDVPAITRFLNELR